MEPTESLSLLTVGDISFRGRYEDAPKTKVFNNVKPFFRKADLVVANLEAPLVAPSVAPVPGKCTLRGGVDWAQKLSDCGIGLVTLANNHMMDYGEEGLFSTLSALDSAEILYVGAGKDKEAASLPLLKKVAGMRVAFLARSSVEVSSRCYAEDNLPGIAFLDENELVDTITQCRNNADLIVVMLHWGMEHYHYPSQAQRSLAKKIVSAGADIVLGHHPHVLQGEEVIGNAVVSYSSGNFLFDEFPWDVTNDEGHERTYLSTLSRKNRQGMMLEVCRNAAGELSTRQHFTRIADNAVVELDSSTARLKEYQKLCSRLHLPFYDRFWKLYSMKCEWDLRLSSQLSPGNIIRKFYKIRPRHFKELAVKIRRSVRVAAGRSTNPYED